ncbi:MAG: hypothetical protein HOD92_19230 [Deltaproteobacteria bacterium]|jgi:hypothetical protein|nr:hypothetical protein [Deltaproteobacteria bacterium]MBT4526627.1 hypothetical protein [Deltaproteobacteria bacterium]
MTDFKRTSSKLSLFLIQIGILVLLITNCTEKQVNPDLLQVLPEDKASSEFPPSPEELIPMVYQVLTLVSGKDATVTAMREEALVSFIKTGFTKYSHVKNISESELKNKLADKAFHGFQPDNVAEAIQLGKALKSRYVSQLVLAVLESKIVESVDRFKATIDFNVFTTDAGQNRLNEKIEYNSADLKKADSQLKTIIQTHFPLMGYILETKGGHQVAKISIGRNVGVKLDREFLIKSRKVESTIMDGFIRKTTTFSKMSVAVGKIIKVMENESWISIPKADRDKIKLGQVVFSQPEKGKWF